MELAQLRYFKTLAETENLTQTSEKLFISAPALSGSISRLEKELKAPLFDRVSGKNLQLNEDGKFFYGVVSDVLNKLDSAQQALLKSNHASYSMLKIATASPMLYQDLLLAFQRSYPDIQISHTFLNLTQLRDANILKQFDFVIAAPDDIPKDLMSSSLLYQNDRPVLIVYRDHPFAHRASVSLSELRNEPFITVGKELSSRKMFDSVFQEAGFKPNIILECDHAMRDKLIQEKCGIGLSTLYVKLSSPNASYVFVDLSDCTYMRMQNIFWDKHKAKSKKMETFRNFAIEYYKKIDRENADACRYFMDNSTIG